MAGNCEGARKTVKKILARDPDFYKRIGHIGGRKGHTGGFACTEVGEDGLTGAERAKVAGAIGGKISRRGFKKTNKGDVDNDGNSVEGIMWVM